MFDVVVNHNAWVGNEISVVYSDFNPFNQLQYYHPFCEITDYTNQTLVDDCWLGDSVIELPDLATEIGFVAKGYSDWISQLVANYSGTTNL